MESKPWGGLDRRQLLFAALDLLTSISYIVNSVIGDEGLSQELQPRLDELRALLIAEIALINHQETNKLTDEMIITKEEEEE